MTVIRNRIDPKTLFVRTALTIGAVLLTIVAACGQPDTRTAVTPSTDASAAVPDALEYIGIDLMPGSSTPPVPVIAIHGLGDSPENFRSLFADLSGPIRLLVPHGLKRWGRGWSWFDVSIPVRHADERLVADIDIAATRVCAFIEQARKTSPLARKPVVTGFSQGGILSFAAAARCPEVIGLAIPVAGLLPPELMRPDSAGKRALPTVYALHGADDDIVAYSHGVDTAERFKAAGYIVELKTYPGVGHEITLQMQEDLSRRISRYVSSGQ